MKVDTTKAALIKAMEDYFDGDARIISYMI
jgi:hypothetical protein